MAKKKQVENISKKDEAANTVAPQVSADKKQVENISKKSSKAKAKGQKKFDKFQKRGSSK